MVNLERYLFMIKSSNDVEKLIDSMLAAFGNMDLGTFAPMSNFMFHPLFAKEWVEKIEDLMIKVKKQKISIKKLAKNISGPSNLRVQIFFLLLDLKCAKIKKNRRNRIANFVLSILKHLAVRDKYGITSNIMHTKQEIKKILKNINNKGKPNISKLLGRLYSAAYHLTNGLYTDFYTDFGVECFGQYRLNKNHILVIRKFNDLRPKELWHNGNSPCKKLTIYTIYKNVEFTCDAISVHSLFKGDHINNLVAWCVQIDGIFENSIDKLGQLTDKLEKESIIQWKRITSLNFEGLKEKGLYLRCYTFKGLFNIANIDWKPTIDMINAVKHKPFADKNYWNSPKHNQKKFWKKLLNPNINFYPEFSWIDELMQASKTALNNMDIGTMKPINFTEIEHYFAKEWVFKIFQILEKSKELKISHKTLAKVMHAPSVKRVEVLLTLINAKLANIKKEYRIKIAEFFYKMLKSVCLTDPFAMQKNIIHNKAHIKKIKSKLKPANPKIAKKLGRLTNSCYNLSYGLYGDINPQICYDNFGPYKIGKGILVIKKFQNLMPIKLWGDLVSDIPCNTIKLYCYYENVDFSIDMLTHTILKGDTINDLKKFAIEIDNKPVKIEDITQISEKLEKKAVEMWKILTSLDSEKAKVKYLEQRCYNYVNICGKLGLDWKPSKGMLNSVKDKKLKNIFPPFNNKNKELEFWLNIIDPRMDINLSKYSLLK